MNRITAKWIIIPLFLFTTILTACRPSAAEDTNANSNSSSAADIEPSAADISSEIVAGDLGHLLDDYITRDKPLFSGSILVAQDGEILLRKGYNFANWELKVPNRAHTKYRISSITKPFTATMIMMLAENHRLSLDDLLCMHLPDCPAAWQEISIRQLLNHTSGIPDYSQLPRAVETSIYPHTVETLIDSFRGEALEFFPGETYQYSNSNYILLGAVIEQISGIRYGKFLESAILNPLKVEDSGMDNAPEILKDRAAGYQILGRALVNAPYLDMSNAYATGGMYSTIDDLFTFDQALYGDLLLDQEYQEIMYTPQFAADGSGGSYGLGWQLSENEDHRWVGHSGSINGFRVFLGRYLDDRVTIILLSNIETEDIGPIIGGLEQIVFNGG